MISFAYQSLKKIKSHSIFWGIAITGILILSIFTYLSKNAILSEDDAAENVKNFYSYYHNLTKGNFIIFALLLFISNIMYVRQKYWDTFIWTGIIFFVFTLIDWWWLSEMVFHYKKTNKLWDGGSNLGPIVGIVISLLGMAITIINYYVLKIFVKDKPNSEQEKNSQPNIPSNENEIRTNQ